MRMHRTTEELTAPKSVARKVIGQNSLVAWNDGSVTLAHWNGWNAETTSFSASELATLKEFLSTCESPKEAVEGE